MIRGYHPVVQALLASLFTWGVTALGAGVVFISKTKSTKLLDSSLGFAAGAFAFLPVAVGFILGAVFVHFADRMLPTCLVAEEAIMETIHMHQTETQMSLVSKGDKDVDSNGYAPAERPLRRSARNGELRQRRAVMVEPSEDREVGFDSRGRAGSAIVAPANSEQYDDNIKNQSWRRIMLLILAVTVHNIPEGLAVGVGFGSVGKSEKATFESAFNLALGIGLQNFPEGLAVSLPLAAFGRSKARAFWWGQLSGMVEPFAALLGAGLVVLMEPILPYALAFAAGAMIYVVVDDIIPEAQRNGNAKWASVFCIFGFVVMMSLDVGLG
ncbi:unnamed protein product, partial [Mesorhabditis belari]|uniref:Zinc transporter ZIP11 n=1 Tax=Mesorhabditis belari TaxID=2138241 RepID=A0AAF3FEC8_9BILA